MRRSFDEALAEARRYEEGFASLLAERDYYVIPTYDYSGAGDGKAPKAKAPPGAEESLGCAGGYGATTGRFRS
jgi:hypothetical protein